MTTILCVRKDNKIVMAGDGQVSLQNTIMKPSARKLRVTFDGKVVAGEQAVNSISLHADSIGQTLLCVAGRRNDGG